MAEAAIALQAPPGARAAEMAGFGGDVQSALQARINMVALFYVLLLPTDMFPEALGQTLIGMALFRAGFFTPGGSTRAYSLRIAFGYLVCVPAKAWLAANIARAGSDPLVLQHQEVWQQVTRPFIGLSNAAVVRVIARYGALQGPIDRLAAAGRTAKGRCDH